jgi:DNA-binding winged helix-turn-helix (wHTH) protein
MSSNRSRKDVELRVLTTTQMCWELGPFIADAAQSRLTHQGQPVSLTPKAFDLLVHLLRHRSQLVTRSELLDAVWPDGFVSDGSLTDTVWMARRALGHLGHWIETIPKRGYRFVGEAREIIGGGESERHSLEVRQATSNIEAFQLCLQGRHFCHEWPASAFHRGRECLEINPSLLQSSLSCRTHMHQGRLRAAQQVERCRPKTRTRRMRAFDWNRSRCREAGSSTSSSLGRI